MAMAAMLVHVAESGLSFELECTASTSVEEVQSYLASLTRVPSAEQLLIVGDTRLEPQRSLGSYRLPHDARPVFLFSRSRLTPDCPPPEPEPADRFANALQQVQVMINPEGGDRCHPLEESRDPALRALPSYERQFCFHLHKGRAIAAASQRKLDACRLLVREQQVQEMALETARANMEHYYKMIDQLYHEFLRHFNRQHRQHSELLSGFDKGLERLRACKLHPALRSDTHKALIDLVKESSLRKWTDDCAISHKQFFGKVAQLKSEYSVLQRSVEDLLVTGSTVNVRLLEDTVAKYAHYVEEQASIIQSLSKDVNTVRRLIDDCMSSQYTASMRPHDAVSALGPMYEVHDKSHLPTMEACDNELRNLLDTCRRSKSEMSMAVHMRMQNVAALQASIRDMRNQLSAFKEAMARQDDIFDEIKVVRKVGPAYKACLAELVRRKAYMKLYMGQAGQLAEKLARKRELEIARREEFLQMQSVYIPREVLGAMGLFDFPSQCIVNIAPFDIGLLDIDVADIERYAPEALVGTLYKVGEGTVTEAAAAGGLEPDEPSNDRDLDEIAGTSRLEVENTWLKAELASATAMLCNLDYDYETDSSKLDGGDVLAANALKTAEALQMKDAYAKQLRDMLGVRQQQCEAYEKRIRELESSLREQDVQIQKLTSGNDASKREDQVEFSESSGITVAGRICAEPMEDEGVTSRFAREHCEEELDDCMAENIQSLDVPMTETRRREGEGRKTLEEKEIKSLQAALHEKMEQCGVGEEKLKNAVATIAQLRGDLDCTSELLRECQMNSAHLENRLHEAREDARAAAERRAAEHASLRSSSVRLRGLVERLMACISSPVDGALADSLRALSSSLSGCNESGEDASSEFQASIRVMVDRVATLVQQRSEVLERCSSLEAAQAHLNKEIESKAELLKSLYAKHKLEKQASKEKICLTHFELHELAVFTPNSAGHWEAVNSNCPSYYLSDESIALFREQLAAKGGRQYIVGRIVHINRNIAKPVPVPVPVPVPLMPVVPASEVSGANSGKSRANPYDLPVGCEYFVVTVALPPAP